MASYTSYSDSVLTSFFTKNSPPNAQNTSQGNPEQGPYRQFSMTNNIIEAISTEKNKMAFEFTKQNL